MFATADPNPTTNKEKIQLLREKLKNLDAIPVQKSTLQASFSRSRPAQEASIHTSAPNASNSFPNPTYLPLELKYMQVEQKYIERTEQQLRLLTHLEDQIQSLQEQSRLVRKAIDRTSERGQENIAALDKQMGENVHELIEELRYIKKELIDQIEQKYRVIKSETMAVAGSQFENQWEESRTEVVKLIAEIRGKMEVEEAARDERVNFMVSSFGEEILKLQQSVQREKQERAESHRKLKLTVQLMQQEIANKAIQERRECAVKQVQLQDSLEQLCFKIESHLLR